jgi:hypothetical protein
MKLSTSVAQVRGEGLFMGLLPHFCAPITIERCNPFIFAILALDLCGLGAMLPSDSAHPARRTRVRRRFGV